MTWWRRWKQRTARHGHGHGDGERGLRGLQGRWAWVRHIGYLLALTVVYFLVPADVFGPHRPVLGWSVFSVALTLITLALLVRIRDALSGRGGGHPVVDIGVLTWLTLHVFATAYLALAHRPGAFEGSLRTQVDALYFTLVTVATVGYGDITAHGQTARIVVMLQIGYTLVFLTAAATAVSSRVTSLLRERAEQGRD